MGLTGMPPAVFMREGNAADPRAMRTRQLLLAAFERQLENGRSAPTVSSLAQEAGVSRSSFYNHFSGAENVGVAAFRELLDEFTPSRGADRDGPPASGNSRVSFEELFRHLGEHRVLCLAVLVPDPQTPALSELHGTLVAHLTEAIGTVKSRPGGLDARRAAIFVVGGILSLLVDWLQEPAGTAADLAVLAEKMLPDWLREQEPFEAPILVTEAPQPGP